MNKETYQRIYENATPNERIYMRAKREYDALHGHHEALRVKIRKQQKVVNALSAELNNQSSKLQRMQEDLAQTIERFKAAKEVYGPLRQAWKETHPKERAGARERGNTLSHSENAPTSV